MMWHEKQVEATRLKVADSESLSFSMLRPIVLDQDGRQAPHSNKLTEALHMRENSTKNAEEEEKLLL